MAVTAAYRTVLRAGSAGFTRVTHTIRADAWTSGVAAIVGVQSDDEAAAREGARKGNIGTVPADTECAEYRRSTAESNNLAHGGGRLQHPLVGVGGEEGDAGPAPTGNVGHQVAGAHHYFPVTGSQHWK